MTKNLIFGTWELDGKHKSLSDEEIKKLLMYAKKCGINMFDTALVYGGGNVEKLLGEVLDDKDYIITKVPALTKPELDSSDYRNFYFYEHIVSCINKSLTNLNRKKIECVLLHNWALNWDIQPLKWLHEFKQNGVVDEIGISLPNNFNSRLSDEILSLIDVIEIPYNIANIWSEKDIPYYKLKGKKVYIRSIFNKGNDIENDNYLSIIEKVKTFNCPLVIGMTNHLQIHNNYLWTLSKNDIKLVVDMALFENDLVVKSKSGKSYCLNNQLFGTLSKDINSPLHCVSVSNNSLSIDIWKGCSFQCKYCHVQGIYEDIEKYGKMNIVAEKRNNCSVEEIVTSLFNHPFFVPNKSIISIGTSSTEPLAYGKVLQSTIDIMKTFIKYGLKNTFWIVTKAGLPIEILDDIKQMSQHGNKIMFSICYAGNPKEIEPAQNNRFLNVDKFADIENVEIAWYLRPLVEEWGANKENLNKLFDCVSKDYGKYIKYIVPGGMRWTEGIEYALTEINNIQLPDLVKENNIKTLGDNIIAHINNLCKKYFPDVEVFYNSSCPISRMLNKSNITMADCVKNNCINSLCKNQCSRCINVNFYSNFSKYLKSLGLDVEVFGIEKRKIKSVPEFKYLHYVQQQIIKQFMAGYLNEKCV